MVEKMSQNMASVYVELDSGGILNKCCIVHLVGVAGGFANANHVKCIVSPARVVGMRRKCLFSHAMTDLCIAVHVTNHIELVTQTTENRVGNLHDRDFGKAR